MRRMGTTCALLCVLAFCTAGPGPANAEPPLNDTCDQAEPIWLGPCSFDIEGTTVGATDDYNPYDPLGGGCLDRSADEADVTYFADLWEGGVLYVVLYSSDEWDPVMYVVTDCDNVAESCVAVSFNETGRPTLDFVAATEARYYLIVDAYEGEGSFTGYIYRIAGVVGSWATALEEVTWGTVKTRYR